MVDSWINVMEWLAGGKTPVSILSFKQTTRATLNQAEKWCEMMKWDRYENHRFI